MRTATILSLLASALLLAACSEHSGKTAMQVKREYAVKFQQGFDFGLSGTVRARSYDPVTYDLLDVQIENVESTLIHAKRAQIIINPEKDTMMLRLQDVVGADVDLGHMVEMEGFSTAEVPLGFDVRP